MAEEPTTHPQPQIAYKTALYRAGDKPNDTVWCLKVEMIEVEADEVDDHLLDGWHLHPLDIDKPEPGPLDRPVTEIAADLPAMTLAELEELRAAEVAGKTRKGLLAKIDEAIEAAKKDA